MFNYLLLKKFFHLRYVSQVQVSYQIYNNYFNSAIDCRKNKI